MIWLPDPPSHSLNVTAWNRLWWLLVHLSYSDTNPRALPMLMSFAIWCLSISFLWSAYLLLDSFLVTSISYNFHFTFSLLMGWFTRMCHIPSPFYFIYHCQLSLLYTVYLSRLLLCSWLTQVLIFYIISSCFSFLTLPSPFLLPSPVLPHLLCDILHSSRLLITKKGVWWRKSLNFVSSSKMISLSHFRADISLQDFSPQFGRAQDSHCIVWMLGVVE